MSDYHLIEGYISIEAAMRAGNRLVEVIYIREDKWDVTTRQLQRLAREANVPLERVSQAAIDGLVSGRSHGGIVARVGPRQFQSLPSLLEEQPNPCIVMIDGVEDPFNFGQAVRSLYAAGVDGLVVRPRNWLSATEVVTRASAGASEWMPTAVAETVEEAADYFSGAGLKVACAVRSVDAVSIYKADLSIPLFLVIGGEKRGISRAFLNRVELRLLIPYGRPFDPSLGTSSSVAVLAFEMMRQRKHLR